MVHKDLRDVVIANRKGYDVSLDDILAKKSVQEAMERSKFEKSTLEEFGDSPERQKLQKKLADRLLDNKSNGAMVEDENGKKSYTGEVAAEKKAFLVIGRPAGGKSSVFADPISAENKARIIDSDIVKGWMPEFDDGFGAGRCQAESDKIMQSALSESIKRGENIVVPKIGGKSIITLAKRLKDEGYHVSLLYNEVSEQNSIKRAMSRFAETGRFLSPVYLKSIGDKPTKTFKQIAQQKDLIDYAEWKNNDVPFGKKPKHVWKSGEDDSKLKD